MAGDVPPGEASAGGVEASYRSKTPAPEQGPLLMQRGLQAPGLGGGVYLESRSSRLLLHWSCHAGGATEAPAHAEAKFQECNLVS